MNALLYFMDFDIRHIGSEYSEYTIKGNGGTVESGTLDRSELISSAMEFLDALDDITRHIKGDHQEIDGKMIEIRDYLEGI